MAILLVACDPDDPEPINPDPTAAQIDSSDYYLEFTDNGIFHHFNANGQLVESIFRKNNFDNGANWQDVGMDFEMENLSYGYALYFEVNMPIDSTRMELLQLNYKYLINDSVSVETDFREYPGTIIYHLSKNGTFYVINAPDTSQFFNRVTSVQYIGNRRFNSIEDLWLCDYEITGNFEMMVQNNYNDSIRTMQNGEYRMLVNVIAE